ncbi:BC_2427 family protein [Bacillus paramycoides]|uniref:BC_2427 family protein n=1 Tax=Bacillus paramycoides TaxID=2026194 RepID=UPI003D22E32F
MKNLWINHGEMREISSKQMIVFKSSTLKNKLEDQEKVDEIDSVDETNNTFQTDSILEIPDLSESDFMNELGDQEEVDEIDSVDETNNTFQTDSILEISDLPKFDFMNELGDQEEVDEIDSVDLWINHSKMSEISSKQMIVFKSSTLKNNLEDQEKVNEIDSVDETNNTFQIDSILEIPDLPESDFMNELGDQEEVNEIHSADETNNTFQTDVILEISDLPEFDFMNELGDQEEVNKIDSVDETNNTFQTDVILEISDLPEFDFMNELGDQEEVDDIDSVDETNNTFQTDFIFEIPDLPKFDFMNELGDQEEVDEIDSLDETNNTFQIDSILEIPDLPESDFMNELGDQEEVDEIDSVDCCTSECDTYEQGKVCSMTKKSSFSTHVKIDDFFHAPICSNSVQNTFEFIDLNNKQSPQFDTKLFNTITYYPEQFDCRLVSSEIHEIIFLTDTYTYGMNNKDEYYKSVVFPLHDSLFKKTGKINNNSYTSYDCMHIRVPVVIGEYKIEICLEENIVFEEKVIRVKEISKEVVLTNCKFIPTQISQSLGNGICTVLKGNLFIEGYIHQNIEYIEFDNRNGVSIQKKSATHLNQICQKIVLDLIIHLLQVQQVQVNYDGKIFKS